MRASANILEKESLIGRKLFNYYEKKTATRREKITDRDELKKVYGVLTETIADEIAYSDSGVWIDGFGYFTALMRPMKIKAKRMDGKEFYNDMTGHHFFYLIFDPIRRDSPFQYWSMDKTFSVFGVKRKFAKRLKRGDMPLTRIYELYKLYGRKKFKK